MTTEITRGKSAITYRINPFNNREIDWRYNRHGARWQRHSIYTTPVNALKALYALQEDDTDND